MDTPGIRFSLLTLGCVFLAGCGAWSAEQRLEALETQAQSLQVVDLRLAHIEERLTAAEQGIGALQAPATKGRKVEPRRVASPPVLSATPEAGVPLSPTPVPTQPADGKNADPAASLTPTRPEGKHLPAGENGTRPVYGNSGSHPYAALSEEPLPPPSAVSASLAELRAGAPRLGSPLAGSSAGPRRIDPAQRPAELRSTAPHAPAKAAHRATGAQAAYDAALGLYEKGEYTRAQQAFSDFLQTNGGSPLAPNALYWIGECYYSTGKMDTAIVTFKDVAGKYPKHPKAAAALLKAGFAYAKLNDMDNARFYWQMLLDDFPGSQPANIARQRIAGK